MKLKDCNYGVLVTNGERVGMVVGITNNTTNCALAERRKISNAIPVVEWSSGEKCGIHNGNIEVFKG